ncbi:hypothetical protein [Picosynechococcus sp. NKBG15041c]|uniref:hypothetical protein n=1 Tax=Picosynechococcus sp. NKBG15041c TaxID=1407650 RepID=UPI0003FF6064|nr:hypothetical protein [Picosynechococcus sp. NKBG15041c]
MLYDRNQAQRKLGIGKSQYYEYLKATGIKPERRDGRTTITQEELDTLLAYKEALNSPAESSSESFISTPESQPESTPPLTPENIDSDRADPSIYSPKNSPEIEADLPQIPADITPQDEQIPVDATGDFLAPQGSELATDSGGEFPVLYGEEEVLAELPNASMNDFDLSDEDDLNALVRMAQVKKANQLLQPELVMAHLVEQMTEDDLPEDLRRKIEHTRRAIRDPLAHPAAIASQILTKYRSGSTQKT